MSAGLAGAASSATGNAAAPGAKPARRAALFLPSLDGGGVERTFVTIALGLAARGIAAEMVLARAEGELLSVLPPEQRVIDLGARKTATSLPGLLGYLRSRPPDTLLTSMNAAVVALVAKRFFLPETRVVVHYGSTFSKEFRLAPPARRAMLRALRRLLPAADLVFTGSRGAAADLGREVPGIGSKLRAIRLPVADVERVAGGPPPRHPWFGGSGPPVVVAMGRLDAGKDYETLIRAFAELRRHRRARLVVLGEGPLRGVLESRVRALDLSDSVDLPGFVPEPHAYVARARVFAHSSKFEGFGQALVEALACGTPVVSTDCAHGPAEILGGGKWGRLVPVGDWRAMAAALMAVLDTPPPRASLVARGRAFSMNALADRYVAALFPAS